MSDLVASELIEIPEEELLEYLIQDKNLDPAAIEALLQQQSEQFAKAQQAISGTAFLIDPASKSLIIQDYLSQEKYAEFPLTHLTQVLFSEPTDDPFQLPTMDRWGSAICCVNPFNGSIEGFLKLQQEPLYGLVITAQDSFLYSENPLESQILARSQQCLYHQVHKVAPGNTAFDLYLSEDRSYLCISDRDAGKLILVSTESRQIIGQVKIRAPGSSKALNVSFDYYEPLLFVSDQQSARLYRLSLPDLELEEIRHELSDDPGVSFGNLLRAPDIRYLFVLMLKPKVSLQYFNLESGEFEEEIPLRGSCFSSQHMDPCDLMLMAPDQNHLLVMTSHTDPTPFTPCISVIHAHQLNTVRYHTIPNALKEQTKPVGLVFPFQNQILNYRKSKLELLLAQGLIQPEDLESGREAIRVSRQFSASDEPDYVDLDDPNGPRFGQGKVPRLTPQLAEPIKLDPAQAIPAILFALRQKLYQQTEIDLEEHPAELERFKNQAESYRQLLENFDCVQVDIQQILDKHQLETLLTRQEVLSLISSQSYLNQEVARAPFHCPSCHQRLKGNWDCPTCFLELESPSRRRKKQQSSLDSLGALSRFHILVADPKRRRLLILDDNKTIDWDLQAAALTEQYARLFPHVIEKLLPEADEAADTSENQLEGQPEEVDTLAPAAESPDSESGSEQAEAWSEEAWSDEEPSWSESEAQPEPQSEAETLEAAAASEQGAESEAEARRRLPRLGWNLWNALWLSNRNILVVDRTGSQLFECSPTGKILWHLDQLKHPELTLKNPVKATYFSEEYSEHFLIVDQGNHRVLVINRKQQLVWQYGVTGEAGSEAGYLCSPSDIQLTFEGSYLISDTGNHRVIEVQGDEIIRSFGSEQGLHTPVFAQRLYDHDTLIVDAGNYRLLELDLDGELVSECFYFSEDMEQEMRIDHPTRVYRREKKSVVLMDQDKIIEVQPLKQRVIWSSLCRHLSRRVEIRRDAFDKSDSYVQAFTQYRMPTLEELINRLREENRLSSSSGIAERIFENLKILIEARRELDAQRDKNAYAKIIHEGSLQRIPLYVLDRTNHQVVQIARDGEVLWHVGSEPEFKLQRPNLVCETPDGLLIADTQQDRIIEISKHGQVLQLIGSKEDKLLSMPRSAWRTLIGNTLISDQGHKRLVEFDPAGNLVWEYHTRREISFPCFAAELGQGTILFVDWVLHMVKEINREGELIWTYGTSSRMGDEENRLSSPEYAIRLHSGAILIADTGNSRIIEVSPKGKILWEFQGNKKYTLHKPNYCQRLSNGNTLIAYNTCRNLLEVNRDGEACWYFELGRDPLVRTLLNR